MLKYGKYEQKQRKPRKTPNLDSSVKIYNIKKN